MAILLAMLNTEVDCKRLSSSYWTTTRSGSQATRDSPGNNYSLRNASWGSTCTHIRTNGLISSPNLPNTSTQHTVVSSGIRKMHRRVPTRLAYRPYGSNPVLTTLFGSVTSDARVVRRTAGHKPNIRTTMDAPGSSSKTMFLIVTGHAIKSSTSTRTRSYASPTKASRAPSVSLGMTTHCSSSQAEITIAKRQNFLNMSSVLQSSRNTSLWPR